MRNIFVFALILAVAVTAGCVSGRKYEEEVARRKAAEAELATAKTSNQNYETQVNELNRQLTETNKQLDGLRRDTSICGTSFRRITAQYDQLLANYELLLKQNRELMQRTTTENTQLVGKLNLTQEQLIRKEDSLRRVDISMRAQKRSLDSLTTELGKREARVKELEAALAAKDQALNDIRLKVKQALVGFEGNGLTIEQKNGKIYVSMEDKLLFATGSTKVQPKGEEALKTLSNVLAANTDINVMVEGHTDDVPMKGAGEIKDNWDLSVMRATSVTKILLQNKAIDPKRITAAGHGEHMPVDAAKTPEARAKNRRTDIVLTPKLDELFKVLGN
ncbi:MAG: OmpA family protein [Bacteroidetes bacterium]|nr:OmpA family protein [Bacteroidota bacterium]